MKTLLNLKGTTLLGKAQQKAINGGGIPCNPNGSCGSGLCPVIYPNGSCVCFANHPWCWN